VVATVASARAYDAFADGRYESVDELPGGRVRARSVDGARQVAIVGPASVTVGATATFSAETRGVERALWIAPDGAVNLDTAELHVRTRSAGRATVTLVGVDGEGRQLVATLVLQVLGT
jgi:hypothetical protein